MAEILLRALELMFSSKLARLDRVAGAGGDPCAVSGARVGGRCDTQSWTRRETRGFDSRFKVFLDEGLVVIIIVG